MSLDKKNLGVTATGLRANELNPNADVRLQRPCLGLLYPGVACCGPLLSVPFPAQNSSRQARQLAKRMAVVGLLISMSLIFARPQRGPRQATGLEFKMPSFPSPGFYALQMVLKQIACNVWEGVCLHGNWNATQRRRLARGASQPLGGLMPGQERPWLGSCRALVGMCVMQTTAKDMSTESKAVS